MAGPEGFARFAGTEGVRAQLKRKSVRGALFVASGGAVDFLLRFGAIAILARLLVPEDFGLLAMVMAVTAIVDGFRDLGLSTATIQRRDITHQQVTNLFWINSLAGAAFAGLFSALSPLIARFFHDGRLVGITIALSTTFVWGGLSAQHEALMNRQIKQGELAAIRTLASVLSLVVAVVLARRGWGYWALVWREVVRTATNSLGVWIRCPWVPGWPRRGADTGSLMRFGTDLSMTHLLTSFIGNIDRLLVGRFFGPAQVGIYRQAQQLLMVPVDQLNAPITAVAQPALSALHDDPARYRRYYDRIAFFVSFVTVPLGVFVAVYAQEIVLLALGRGWGQATPFIRIFGIAAAIRPAIATSAIVLITCGFSTRYLQLALIHGGLLALLLSLGVGWGAEGVAAAHVLTTVVFMLPKLHYSFLGSPVTLRGFLGAIRVPVVAGTLMLGALLLVHHVYPSDGTLRPLVVGLAVAPLFYLTIGLLYRESRERLSLLTSDVMTSLRRVSTAS
jgi:PST family polysaccharide transporter